MKAVLDAAREFYGLSALEYVEGIATGFSGTNHIVTDGARRYVLTRYYQRTEPWIREMHGIMRYFADRGIPVPQAIEGSTGTVLSLEDGYYALFPFVEGRHAQEGNLSEEELAALGGMLARIHQAGANPEIAVSKTKSRPNPEKALEKIGELRRIIGELPVRSAFDELASQVLDMKEQAVRAAATDQGGFDLGPLHLVHGDYHATNVLMNGAGEIVAVLDWEHAKLSPRAIEAVRTAFVSCLDVQDEEKQLRDMSAFLRAYQAAYPLPERELRDAFRFFYVDDAHHFWVEAEHYQNGNVRADYFLQKDRDFLRWFAQRGEVFADQLIDALK